jgi:hypothetical protein
VRIGEVEGWGPVGPDGELGGDGVGVGGVCCGAARGAGLPCVYWKAHNKDFFAVCRHTTNYFSIILLN